MESDVSLSSTQRAAIQPGSDVWFISFGDLLTLLLCFFLVLTPWDKLRPNANPEVKQEVGHSGRDLKELGTVFASPALQRHSLVMTDVPIHAEHVSGESLGGLVSLANTLQQEVAPFVGEAHSLTITVCDPSVDKIRIVAEIGRLTREFDREVLDVFIEVVSDCGRVPILRPTTARVVGVISVRGV